ncbi:MAG TPA: MFS transporter [Pirellulales bacterium]
MSRDGITLRDLSATQWKTGVAAWLGWLFDGLDMHLYTLVALPFVALLLSTPDHAVDVRDPAVGVRCAWIQAAFLIGWALGGGVFGRIGDRMGRSRALTLTILTYAVFTGLSFFSQTWWQLLIFRFLAALGIGGEWAVGAALILETWPQGWRHWIAAVLQSAVNVGILFASFACYLILTIADLPNRSVFLLGILPALIVLWIRRAVPEPDEWQNAKAGAIHDQPKFADLFRGPVRRTTILVILVCASALSAHWAFMFWFPQHLRNLPDGADWTDGQRSALASSGLAIVMTASIVGNFIAGYLAKLVGFRLALALMCVAYFAAMCGTYGEPHDHTQMYWWLIAPGLSQGVFALFAMYLPPLFPTLLRTTGAGFCYNIGRLAAAFGTVYFGSFSREGDYRLALFYSGFLFLPAAAIGLLLPELRTSKTAIEPLE